MGALADFAPGEPQFEVCIRVSFDRQAFMHHIGVDLAAAAPREAQIRLPWRFELAQQHAYFHGGVIGTVVDNACGAAFSLSAAFDRVLTVEYKLNLIAPSKGEALIARGKVVKACRTLTIRDA